MKLNYKEVLTGLFRDFRNAHNQNMKDIESDIIETNQRVTGVDSKVDRVDSQVNTRIDGIDEKVEEFGNKSVHFDEVDAELSEHGDLLEQLKASSIDGEVIAARNGFPSLLDFLKSLNPGATIATKTFTATAGQTTIDLTDTGELQAIGKIILFLIDGAPQWNSYTWTNSKTLTMKSAFAGGEEVVIRYFVGNVSIRTGHNRGHEKGGFDELDVYRLKNGDVIRNNISDISVKVAEAATKTELANIGNGSPKGTYATLSALQTAYPTGTTGVYVVTADGKWYYWNGSTWTAGGIYQTTGLDNNSIDTEKITFKKSATNNKVNPFLFKNQLISGTTGNTSSSTIRDSTDFIQVATGQTLYFVTDGTITLDALLSSIMLYDTSKVFIGARDDTNMAPTSINSYSRKYTCAFDGFIRIVVKTDTGSSLKNLCINDNGGFEPFLYSLDDNFKKESFVSYVEVKKNMVNVSNSVSGYINSTGIITSSTSYKTTEFIKIEKNVNYVISPRIRKLLLFNEFKNIIYSESFIDADTPNYVLNSSKATYVRFSYYSSDNDVIQMEKGTTPTALEKYALTIPNFKSDAVVVDSTNPLYGKKLLNFGDSIAAGDGNNGTGYGELIAVKNGMTVYDYAVGGTTIAVVTGKSRIMTKINEAITNGITPDYILFDGGTNDAIEGRTTTGVITAGYTDTLDNTTFCGGFEETCKTLKLNWLGKKIIYVRVHNMGSRTELQKTYGDLAAQICKKWSIPVVDLYNEGGLNTQITEMATAYTNVADKTHPNADGYNIYYVPQIEAKMKMI